jgi:hypothetical protein
MVLETFPDLIFFRPFGASSPYFAQPTASAVGCILCAEHVGQLGGGSPLPNLVEVKG